jgi:hypothetical protein
MAHHTPDGMGADRYNERQNMQQARHSTHQLAKENEYALQVTRPHPSLDRGVTEIWGRGTKSEIRERKRAKEQEYDDSYTFEIIEE